MSNKAQALYGIASVLLGGVALALIVLPRILVECGLLRDEPTVVVVLGAVASVTALVMGGVGARRLAGKLGILLATIGIFLFLYWGWLPA